MLLALMSGRALTAKELAYLAGITPQTASEHLNKLVGAKMLTLTRQSRFHYFRLASPAVARLIESIMTVVPAAKCELPDRAGRALATARLCYDHLAGKLGVSVAAWLAGCRYILLDDEGGEVTPAGLEFFAGFGIEAGSLQGKRRPFCRLCLDWTERRFHVAGALGAALAQRFFQLRWIQRVEDSRALIITKAGLAGIEARFGIRTDQW